MKILALPFAPAALALALASPACAPEEDVPLDCAGQPGDNEAPVVDFIQPGEGVSFAPGESIHFIVKVEDDRDAPGDLQVTFEDSLDGVLEVPPPRTTETGPDGGVVDLEYAVFEFDHDGLGEGIHALVVTAVDSGGCSGADDRAIQICPEGDCL